MEIVVCALVVVSVSLLLIVGYYYAFPKLPFGTWSEPLISQCAGTSQDATSHSIYKCSPNPITGFGCVVPNTGDKEIIYKDLVLIQQCSTTDLRNISFVWEAQATKPTTCISDGKTCCDGKNCYVETDYQCFQIAPEGGENRCTQSYLQGTLPPLQPFDPSHNNGYIGVSITTRMACLGNLCTP